MQKPSKETMLGCFSPLCVCVCVCVCVCARARALRLSKPTPAGVRKVCVTS